MHLLLVVTIVQTPEQVLEEVSGAGSGGVLGSYGHVATAVLTRHDAGHADMLSLLTC